MHSEGSVSETQQLEAKLVGTLAECTDACSALGVKLDAFDIHVKHQLDGLTRLAAQCSTRLGDTWRDALEDDLTLDKVEQPRLHLNTAVSKLMRFFQSTSLLWQHQPPQNMADIANSNQEPASTAGSAQVVYLKALKDFANFYHSFQTSRVGSSRLWSSCDVFLAIS